MAKERDWSGLDDWLTDVAQPTPIKETRDDYDIEKTYPYRADTVPRISYVELAWLGYYVVHPEGKGWCVQTCDGMAFRDSDRREAIRAAQGYCTAWERGEIADRHLPKPLRAIVVKPRRNSEPPF